MAETNDLTDHELWQRATELEPSVDGDDADANCEYSRCVMELNITRATRSIFDTALGYAMSSAPSQQRTGIDVLNDFGPHQNFPWRDETTTPLLAALGSSELRIVHAALSALGKFGPSAALEGVLHLADHTDAGIRLSLAIALPRFATSNANESDPAIRALISLTNDPDDVIRDWATFGLGSQTDADGTVVRHALLERLDDVDANTRNEALVALARRHDQRAVPFLLRALKDDTIQGLAITAAEVLGTAQALAHLRELATSPNWSDNDLALALQRCDPEAQERLLKLLCVVLDVAEERGIALVAFSDRIPVVSGGPQLGLSGTDRYTWSLEELLDRADDDPFVVLALIQSDVEIPGNGSTNEDPVHSSQLVRYWYTFDLAALEPIPAPSGVVRLDGDSLAHRLLWRGVGVSGWDENDCRQLIADAISPEAIPPVIGRVTDVDVDALGIASGEIGVPVWRGIWFPALNRSGPVPR